MECTCVHVALGNAPNTTYMHDVLGALHMHDNDDNEVVVVPVLIK